MTRMTSVIDENEAVAAAGAARGHGAAGRGRCANCDETMSGPFCAWCGQSAESIERPVWALVEHALETLFDFDARWVRSLKALARPGRLTVLYLAGKRAPFVPPVRLYILTSLFFFLALWATGIAIFQFVAAPAGDRDQSPRVAFFSPIDLTPRSGADAASSVLQVEVGGETPAWVDRMRAGLDRAFREPAALNERLSELFPKMMFGLVPFFALLLWPLYARRRRLLIEHVIFALHLHTFVFLLATVLIAIRAFVPSTSGWTFALPVAAYLLLAMKEVYRQGWLKTAVKGAMVLIVYSAAFGAAMAGLVVMGLTQI